MIETLIAAAALPALLSCADGAWILEGLGASRGMTPTEKYEVYREIRSVMPEDCDLSQYDFQRDLGRPVDVGG